MWRRPELWLGIALVGAMTIVVLAGGANFTENWSDQRRSVRLSGPGGAKGFGKVLERLGVPVQRRERPLFDLSTESPETTSTVLAFLDIYEPTPRELDVIRRYVAHGGRVFVTGYTGIEQCFAYRSVPAGNSEVDNDTVTIVPPRMGLRLAPAERLLVRIPLDSLQMRSGRRAPLCPPLFPVATDTLLTTLDGRPEAVALRFQGGGRVTLLADSRYVSNRDLKETDAALVVLPWLLADQPHGIVVDEYHLGFTRGSTLPGAMWRFLWSTPAGWAVLQLCIVGLIWLATVAVRFGPAREVVERRRRSPLEHVEALAAGLEGAGGADTAVALIVSGLQRRLSRTGQAARGEPRQWLAALELALPEVRGRRAVRRLRDALSKPGGDERVVAAAQAVEDVWEELRPRATPAGSWKH
jgi:uncharacterized protein DUF4350